MKNKAKVVANIDKNRLYIHHPDHVDEHSLSDTYTDVRFCVSDLKDGFDVIVDFSQCNLIYISGIKILKRIINYLVSKKIGEIVRVINSNNICFKQMLNFSTSINCYNVIHANSLIDAEEKIDNIKKRNGIRFKIKGVAGEYQHNKLSYACEINDVSTSGCSIFSDNPNIINDEIINLKLNFDNNSKFEPIFELKSRVVEIDHKIIAVEYIDASDDLKERLYNRLAHEVERTTVGKL